MCVCVQEQLQKRYPHKLDYSSKGMRDRHIWSFRRRPPAYFDDPKLFWYIKDSVSIRAQMHLFAHSTWIFSENQEHRHVPFKGKSISVVLSVKKV